MCKGHDRRLRDDKEWANFLLGELARCPVGTYVVGAYLHAVFQAERRGLEPPLVCVFAQNVLDILHAFSKELVDLFEIDSRVFGSEINHFGVWEDGNQRVISAGGETPVVT